MPGLCLGCATRIVEILKFVAFEAIEFALPDASIMVTRLLREVLRAQEEIHDNETRFFQLNYICTVETALAEQILTND